jgi:hypothetical protein
MIYSVSVPLPDDTVVLPNSKPSTGFVRYEEEATLWMWSWPQLIGWSRPIAWLFSPVVGRRPCPGDLWGVDEEGDLIVVETKFGRGAQDPFADFVGFPDSDSGAAAVRVPFLRVRWEALLRAEVTFAADPSALEAPLAGARLHRGVVPYSYKRFAVRRWRRLYESVVAPMVVSREYRSTAEASLERRQVRGNPPPIFIGAIVGQKASSVRLSSRGEEAREVLIQRGSTVELIGLTASRNATGAEIMSWRVT